MPSAYFTLQMDGKVLNQTPGAVTQHYFPTWTNINIFHDIVLEHPEKVALISRRGCLTYADLNERANRLARYLSSLGLGTDCVVAVALERGLDYIVSLLACWKVSAAYLPLDQSLPANRMQYMISDSKASCIITIKKVMDAKALNIRAGSIVRLDDTDTVLAMATRPGANSSQVSSIRGRGNRSLVGQPVKGSDFGAMDAMPGDGIDQNDTLAYIIYTSGTTGNPKGVGITHRNLFNLIDDIRQSREIEITDRVLLFSPPCFDASIRDMSGALMQGASLYVPDEEEILPGNLLGAITRQQITNSVITPSVLRSCSFEHLPSLSTLVLAGEAADENLIRRWGAGRRLINAYGPTEATVCSTKKIYYDGRIPQGRSAANIGKPILNTIVSIVGENGSPVKNGQVGEIWITGPGVSRCGYLNLPHLNNECFEARPGCSHRSYKTGDLGRFTPEGEIECLGRQSSRRQVKLNGQRIELDELEAVIRSANYVVDAVVLMEGVAAHQSLCAYVVSRPTPPDSHDDHDTLRDCLHDIMRNTLPSYSIPATIKVLDAFPLTANGKLDIKALPGLTINNERPSQSMGETLLNPLEKQVAVAPLNGLDLPNDQLVTPLTTYGELGGNSLQASLVLRHINKSLNCAIQLGQFYRNNISIRQLAELVSGGQKQQACPPPHVLRQHAVLPHDIVHSVRHSKPRPNRHVLLTGATGFLGSHLLAEILNTNATKVSCIIRAPDTDSARQRFESVHQNWGLWDDSFTPRIQVHCGDVSKPFLGLSADEYLHLATSVDTIYHSAAAVSFIAPFSELQEANINGTVEILRFASTFTQKRLTYISTLSVFFEAGNKIHRGREIPVENLDNSLITGYAQTKWASEQLVLSWARLGGHALILRPGRLMGNAQNFKCPRDDFTVRLIAAMLETGIAPELGRWQIDLTPVDFCARVACRFSVEAETGIRHIINQDTISWDEICKCLGSDIKRIPYEEWLKGINSSTYLAPLSSLFHDQVWNGKSTFENLLRMDRFRYSNYESSVEEH
ncbi:MAG: hypothetical protein LQ349_005890, partial [Xanthoria aureola]